jgi:prepilin-type N-terminal cleavage/methylation domain-containing protein
MRPDRLQTRRGFTLLEVIVSMAILSIGLVAVLEAYSAAARVSLQDEFITTATFLAAGKMEEVLKEPYITTGSDEGDFGEEFADFTWTVDITDSEIEGLVIVTVRVDWEGPTGEDYLELTSAAVSQEPTETQTGGGMAQTGGVPR